MNRCLVKPDDFVPPDYTQEDHAVTVVNMTGYIAILTPEAESKEKHGVWDPMPELTI
jgi:hypothetical protein